VLPPPHSKKSPAGYWPFLFLFFFRFSALCQAAQPQPVAVGSKAFTESIILGELTRQLISRTGTPVEHKQNLGGTTVLWQALLQGGRRGGIDVYAEYTGTLTQEILAQRHVANEADLRQSLAEMGISMSRPLGFNDAYALGMKEDQAARVGIRNISDLRPHPDLRFALSNEFLNRADGWPGLRNRYELPQQNVRGVEHVLAYRGLESGSADLTDLYSTDPEIRYYNLRVLEDDLHYFPAYDAVLLYRTELRERAEAAVRSFLQLEGRISRADIIDMNARAKPASGERISESRLAAEFLADNPFFRLADTATYAPSDLADDSLARILLRLTAQHLFLVAVSLAAAILLSLPLGTWSARQPTVGQGILAGVGIIQTIPSLALMVALIPVLGLGARPALGALFLYSLLPIVRNTYTGLQDIPGSISESAQALGLPAAARLRLIDLPLASRQILAGIKTSAVINVGTATLGGIIGAGGYGERIMTGIRLANVPIILQGAIPAALLALLVQGFFELLERWVVPKGLRLKAE
jgi:osmoprotectant transport system permease protein